MLFLPAIVGSLGLVNAAIVTVTNHVHANAVESVQGVLYVENGQTKTTFQTEGVSQPTQVSNPISSSVVAVAGSSSGSSSGSPSSSQASASSTPTSSGAVTIITKTAGSGSSSSGSAAPTSSSAAAQSSSGSAAVSPSESPNAAFASASSTGSPSGSSAATTTLSPSSSSSAAPVSSSAPASSSSQAPSSASSTSSSPSASSTGSGSSSSFQKTMVDNHNDKRSKHQSTGSLEWDDQLASYAQNYADKYDCSGNLQHSQGPYGENLAVGYDDEGTINAWYNEMEKYNYQDPVFSESTGHFTQMVWKSSTKVGCASKQCGGSVGKYIVCEYNPAGNYIGDFAQNVLPTL